MGKNIPSQGMIELMTDYSKRWLNFQTNDRIFSTNSPLQTTDSLQQMNYSTSVDKIFTVDEWILQHLISEAYPDPGSGAFLTSRSGIRDE